MDSRAAERIDSEPGRCRESREHAPPSRAAIRCIIDRPERKGRLTARVQRLHMLAAPADDWQNRPSMMPFSDRDVSKGRANQLAQAEVQPNHSGREARRAGDGSVVDRIVMGM